MKATVKLPKTGKGWFSLGLLVVVILLGCWPVISFMNSDRIIFGMPVLMAWSALIVILTSLSMFFIEKIGGIEE